MNEFESHGLRSPLVEEADASHPSPSRWKSKLILGVAAVASIVLVATVATMGVTQGPTMPESKMTTSSLRAVAVAGDGMEATKEELQRVINEARQAAAAAGITKLLAEAGGLAPGMASLGQGIDSTTWDAVLPVVDARCSDQTLDIGGRSYCVPVGYTATQPQEGHPESTVVYANENAYSAEVDKAISTAFSSVSFPAGIHTVIYARMSALFKAFAMSNQGMTISRREYPVVSLENQAPPTAEATNRFFRRALDLLPQTCDNEEEKNLYGMLLDAWGDSMVKSAVLGGYVSQSSFFHRVLLSNKKLTAQQIAEAAKGEFQNILDPNSHARPLELFRQHRKMEEASYVGGVPELIPSDPKSVKAWEDSIALNPALVKLQAQYIDDIIPAGPVRDCYKQERQARASRARATLERKLKVDARLAHQADAKLYVMSGYIQHGGNEFEWKPAHWQCPKGYLLRKIMANYAGTCKNRGDGDGGQLAGFDAYCFKVWDEQGNTGSGVHRMNKGYPAQHYKHEHGPVSECPPGFFVEGVINVYGGTMKSNCDNDGGVTNALQFICRKFSDFVEKPTFLDGPCKDTQLATPSYGNAGHRHTTKSVSCPDGSLVEGMTLEHGGTCKGLCNGDAAPIRNIKLHCRKISDFFCPVE